MPKFWGYVSNEEYAIGCTSTTVYVYDKEGKELAQLKNIKYGYTIQLSPKKNCFVVKSTGACFGVYSLDTLSLLKTVRYSRVDGSQDDGYCFSIDGNYFYNIERQRKSTNHAISIYDASNFKRIKMFLEEDKQTEPCYIEMDTDGQLYVLGFLRNENGIIDSGFISKMGDTGLEALYTIPVSEYEEYDSLKSLELFGFTDKKKELFSWEYPDVDTSKIENTIFTLAQLWEQYQSANES